MIYGFDLETHLISPGNPAPRGVCVSFKGEDGSKGVMLREDGLEWIRARLEGGDHLVAHNGPYDLSVAAADDPDLLCLIFDAYYEGRIHDTGIRQKILDNAKGILKYEFNEETGEFKAQQYSLAHLVYRHFKKWRFHQKEGDVWRLRYYTLDGVPVEQWPRAAYDYALEDSVDALDVYFEQEKDRFAYLLEHEWTQTQADWALRLMSCWGSRTNGEDIEVLRAQLQEAFDKQVEICKQHKLVYRKKEKGVYKWSRKMKSIYALVEKTYSEYGFDVPLTEKGKVSTSRGTLTMEEYPMIEPHPGMKAVAEMVRIGKLLSTYIPMLLLGTEIPINPRYNAILETYRTSCSKPNIQNLPRDGGVRDCWIAREGYVYVFCDYDTLEMRTLAQVCIWLFGFSEIAEAAKAGRDFHLAFAADMLEMAYEEAEALYESGDKEIAKSRQGNKISNYGLSGGMGKESLISYARGFDVELTMDQADKLHKGFRKMWPEMVKYFQHVSQVTNETDPDLGINLVELLGSGLVRGKVPYCAVANSYFQHLAAMGAKLAAFTVARECYTDKSSPLYGCKPWLFCHDEIGMEVPFDGTEEGRIRASRAAQRLQEIMVACMKHYVPDVPIGATAAMTFRWYKGAKPVYRKIVNDTALVPCKKVGKKWVEDFREPEMMAA